jgi:hypothetical protein
MALASMLHASATMPTECQGIRRGLCQQGGVDVRAAIERQAIGTASSARSERFGRGVAVPRNRARRAS